MHQIQGGNCNVISMIEKVLVDIFNILIWIQTTVHWHFLDIYNMASRVELWIFGLHILLLKVCKIKLKLSSGTNIAVSNPVDSSPNQAWSGLPWI